MKYPNPLMLVRIAQGDAYGIAVEYVKDQAATDQALRFESYGIHPVLKIGPGIYTDDTQMSLAVTEALIGGPFKHFPPRGDEFSSEHFADSFVRCYKRDVRAGYSKRISGALDKAENGASLLATIDTRSDANGAAMRAVPIGVLREPSEVAALARVQAMATHTTMGSIVAAQTIALMSHFALHVDEPLDNLREWLQREAFCAPLPWPNEPVDGTGVGLKTARAVLTLITEETTLLGIAKRVINWGGDTDSVLSIAWGIASARMHDELPTFFTTGLENGTYGRIFLHDVGKKLMELYRLSTGDPPLFKIRVPPIDWG